MSTLPLLLADAVIYHFPPSVNNGRNISGGFAVYRQTHIVECPQNAFVLASFNCRHYAYFRTFFADIFVHGFHHLPTFLISLMFPPAPYRPPSSGIAVNVPAVLTPFGILSMLTTNSITQTASCSV